MTGESVAPDFAEPKLLAYEETEGLELVGREGFEPSTSAVLMPALL